MLESILDPLLGWLLYLPPLLSIIIIAFVISLLITLVYKLVTNQDLMKDLREEQKEFQKQLKELKDKPEKAMKVQSEMMETNLKYMSHSMRPTLFTFVPIILIFGWLNSHMAYYPLYPNNPFEVVSEMDKSAIGEVTLNIPDGLEFVNSQNTQEMVNNQVKWIIKGNEGEYNLTFQYNEEEVSKQILITRQREYYPVEKTIKDTSFKKILIGNEKVKPLEGVPLVGNWGWLGAYILFSIIFSMTLRKILKIY
jgi:uncharacterized membrane protein (DUF106 family)